MASTNGIEFFWGLLKRSYIGVDHFMGKKHLNRYVNAFASRHNSSGLDTIDHMAKVAVSMVNKRLGYKDLGRG